MVQTRRQSMIFNLELKRLEERIGLFAGNTIFLPGNNLSPHSLRNHFDNPSSETLENLNRELETWQKYLAKFVQRQRQ